jgi:cobalamin-dependent methionine synthase I
MLLTMASPIPQVLRIVRVLLGNRKRGCARDSQLVSPEVSRIALFVCYPACPNLEDQTKLFVLLKPGENVGVRLTSGFLLEPEQSTSALVVHHPGAKYFVV